MSQLGYSIHSRHSHLLFQHSSQELASSTALPIGTARACGLVLGVSPIEEEYSDVGGETVASWVSAAPPKVKQVIKIASKKKGELRSTHCYAT